MCVKLAISLWKFCIAASVRRALATLANCTKCYSSMTLYVTTRLQYLLFLSTPGTQSIVCHTHATQPCGEEEEVIWDWLGCCWCSYYFGTKSRVRRGWMGARLPSELWIGYINRIVKISPTLFWTTQCDEEGRKVVPSWHSSWLR